MQKKGIRQQTLASEPVLQNHHEKIPLPHMPKVVVHASRLAELLAGRVKNFFHPKTIEISEEGIKTMVPQSSFFSWVGEEEMIAFSRISSVHHKKGVFWDALKIETLGSANTLDIDGLPKVAADRLAETINRYIP